ncbi:formamidopyrimidine-DNA glycosylase [Gemmatimonadetes bacterium T265]|nr:formamidopyrimidine-DNA glycosylase [Gemmatimonadetes bacterium T265]
MPELPETETIARDLDAALRGAVIADVEVPRPSVLRGVDAAELARRTRGARVERVWRRAKLIVLDLSTGDRLAVQPRFTGTVLLEGFGEPFPEAERRFVRVTFRLADAGGGARAFHYRDIRTLGTVALLAPAEFDAAVARLGPEPLDAAFTADALRAALGRSGQPVKRVLMDQAHLAGVGNIYANEALWAARIHPARPAASLTDAEVRALRDAVVDALDESVHHGGTTFENFLSPRGRRGAYVLHLKTYGRGGRPCFRCGDPLGETHAIDGRTTVFCARCQPAPAAHADAA